MQARARAATRIAGRHPGGSARPQAEQRLIPVLGGLLPLLLVAALTAAITLPRHDPGERLAGLDAPVIAPVAPAAPSPQPGPVVVTSPEVEQVVPAAVDDGPEQEPVAPDAEPAADDPTTEPEVPPDPAPAAVEETAAAEGAPAPPAVEPGPAPAPAPALDPAPAPAPQPAPQPEPAPQPAPNPQPEREPMAASGQSDSERIFAQEHPAHAAARQTDDPATRSWAVLVGVDRYAGRTANTLGSVADVLVLREVLLRHGWRDEHILVLTDGTATHDRVVRGLEWLARSTDERSTVVFSFSGHMRHDRGVSALWPSDNRFIWAGDFSRMMGAIPAGRMWASLQGCHAEGMRAPGLEGDGRIVTYSSRTAEKSYEDPEVGHSVQGYYLFAEGFRDRWGDEDRDGRVSVQEAWRWAAPRAHRRTAQQQTPVISDGAGGAFHLEVGRR